MSDHRKRPRDFSQAATLDFKRDHSNSKGTTDGQNGPVDSECPSWVISGQTIAGQNPPLSALGPIADIAPFISAPQLDATIEVPPCCATYFQNLLTGVVSNGPWRRWHLRQAKKGRSVPRSSSTLSAFPHPPSPIGAASAFAATYACCCKIERTGVPPTSTRPDYLLRTHPARKLSQRFLCKIGTRLRRCCSYQPSGKWASQQTKGPRSTRQSAASRSCRTPRQPHSLDHLIISDSTSSSGAITGPFSHTYQTCYPAIFSFWRFDMCP
jgi:hypothetical protein